MKSSHGGDHLTFAQLLHSLNGPSAADYVRRVAGHCGHKSIARFASNLPNADIGSGAERSKPEEVGQLIWMLIDGRVARLKDPRNTRLIRMR